MSSQGGHYLQQFKHSCARPTIYSSYLSVYRATRRPSSVHQFESSAPLGKGCSRSSASWLDTPAKKLANKRAAMAANPGEISGPRGRRPAVDDTSWGRFFSQSSSTARERQASHSRLASFFAAKPLQVVSRAVKCWPSFLLNKSDSLRHLFARSEVACAIYINISGKCLLWRSKIGHRHFRGALARARFRFRPA